MTNGDMDIEALVADHCNCWFDRGVKTNEREKESHTYASFWSLKKRSAVDAELPVSANYSASHGVKNSYGRCSHYETTVDCAWLWI